MKMFLTSYIGWVSELGNTPGGTCSTTALKVAKMAKQGPWLAQQMRVWTHTFIADHQALPNN